MINKISAFIRLKIGFDGLMHFALSSIISFILSIFLFWWLSFTITVIIGIAKEIYDKMSKKGTPEWKDLLCDIFGALIGSL